MCQYSVSLLCSKATDEGLAHHKINKLVHDHSKSKLQARLSYHYYTATNQKKKKKTSGRAKICNKRGRGWKNTHTEEGKMAAQESIYNNIIHPYNLQWFLSGIAALVSESCCFYQPENLACLPPWDKFHCPHLRQQY